MKKITLLLLMIVAFAKVVYAYDTTDQFYYVSSERITDMWITATKGSTTISRNPYFLRRKSDGAYVYCIQPFVTIYQNTNYEGFYDPIDNLNLSSEDVKRIRLLAYFGYNYPGHEDRKWYGITQYLIWKVADKSYDIYFTDTKFGNRTNEYQEKIDEIEFLISEYQKLLELSNKKIQIYNLDEWEALRSSNYFLKDITLAQNQEIHVPLNSHAKQIGVFYYHKESQNLYLAGNLEIETISLTLEMMREITIKKWYGEGKYELEEGAEFEVYQGTERIMTVITDAYGSVTFTLPHGTYTIVQTKGISGYGFVEPFDFVVGMFRTDGIIELFDEAEIIEVPDTAKNQYHSVPLIFFKRYYYVH